MSRSMSRPFGFEPANFAPRAAGNQSSPSASDLDRTADRLRKTVAKAGQLTAYAISGTVYVAVIVVMFLV